MAVRTCRCRACGVELRRPFGAFGYEVSITASLYCVQCNTSHPDSRSQIWSFCSAKCLLRVGECCRCKGTGKDAFDKYCPECEGRKLVVT